MDEIIGCSTALVVVSVFGEIWTSGRKASEVARFTDRIKGPRICRVSRLQGTRRSQSRSFGLTDAAIWFSAGALLEEIQAPIRAHGWGEIHEKERVFAVSVILDECSRET